MNTKLTMISIRFQGRLHWFFVNAKIVNGKTVVAESVLEELLDGIGVRRGDTYTLG